MGRWGRGVIGLGYVERYSALTGIFKSGAEATTKISSGSSYAQPTKGITCHPPATKCSHSGNTSAWGSIPHHKITAPGWVTTVRKIHFQQLWCRAEGDARRLSVSQVKGSAFIRTWIIPGVEAFAPYESWCFSENSLRTWCPKEERGAVRYGRELNRK